MKHKTRDWLRYVFYKKGGNPRYNRYTQRDIEQLAVSSGYLEPCITPNKIYYKITPKGERFALGLFERIFNRGRCLTIKSTLTK